MTFHLQETLLRNYSSSIPKIRVMTEGWVNQSAGRGDPSEQMREFTRKLSMQERVMDGDGWVALTCMVMNWVIG